MDAQNLLFMVSPPRSGSTLLQRILGSHKAIVTHPEPHLITPMAYLGYYQHVDKAPYDHINAAEAIRAFVSSLPRQEDDYLDALRAYSKTLYGRALEGANNPDARYFLDKTPAYALVLPFLTKLYAEAKYVVLTRHPLAIFSSYAQSFFGGDWKAAHCFNPIVERYVTAIAKLMREKPVKFHALTYESLVEEPEPVTKACFDYLGLAHDPDAINYGDKFTGKKEGMGDPMGVAKHKRPVRDSMHAWVSDVQSHPDKLHLAKEMIARVDPADLALWGYTPENIWQPFDEVSRGGTAGAIVRVGKKNNKYAFQRKVLLALRKDIHRRPLGKVLKRVRYYCDVILRDAL